MFDNDENSNKSQELKEKTINSEKEQEKLKEKEDKNSKKIIDDYLIKETLGKGTFSTVKLGVHIKTNQKVAIKILNKQKIKAKEDLIRIKREIKILSMMDHPNIIKTYKISENSKNYYIIMEYCDGGELFNYIVEKEKLDENEASMFFYQLINALEYIHSLGIAHRDLKPENLLLLDNKIIKIIDFGLSNYFNGEKNLETPCGSPSYASPEIIKGEAYNGFCIDVWASGIIMFAMLCGYLPFDDDDEEEEQEEDSNEGNKSKSREKNSHRSDNNSEESNESDDNEILFQRILEGKLDFPDYLSKDSIDLMKKILVVDPEKRIQIKDIKKHKFFLLGQKNFLLNQKNISKYKTPKIEKIKDKKIINNENIINNININSNYSNSDKNIDIGNIKINANINKNIKNSSYKVENLDVKLIELKMNNNIKAGEENKNEEKNKKDEKHKNKELINEMEEYEKKLFKNYLRNVNAMKKNNLMLRTRKKKSEKRNKVNGENVYPYRLNTLNANPVRSYFSQNLKKFSKNKNNFTLNEIILDFNPNNFESYKQITNPSPKNNKISKYKNNNIIPAIKISPIIRKNSDYQNGFNKNSNSILYYNENNKNINKDIYHNLLTINIPNISGKRRNHTENKLLQDLKYYITNGNSKKIEEQNKHIKYLKIPTLNSIDHSNDIYRIKPNKPFLPIIKPSLFNLFTNSSINHNRDSSFLNPKIHMKTEGENINSRKRILFNGIKNEYNMIVNNTNNSINNDLRYKLFYPNHKNFNFSILKSSH